MSKALGVGIIGCGNISKTYFDLAPLFKGIEIRYCADLYADVARARAAEYGGSGGTVDMLLASGDVDIVVNLTVPDAHAAVSMKALAAGKHVYSEKPLVLSMTDGLAMKVLAEEKGLHIGSAPDTFLGGAHQAARQVIDDGRIGRITSGTCQVMSHGMEAWHPNPDFFFKPGGGPMLDMGPYYITNLVNMLGPVKRVAALTSIATPMRTITSQPRAGEKISVETPTTIQALLEFECGATITFIASWDVWAHRHHPMELYGTEGTLYIPDPNFFGGDVCVIDKIGTAHAVDFADHPFGVTNQDHGDERFANYRTAGLADMAQSILDGREYRCSFDMSLHVVEVMTAILKSGETREFVEIATSCSRPAALSAFDAQSLLC